MTETFKEKIKHILPPTVALPLLFSYLIDHIAISNYWIFFGISLEEDLAPSYLVLALILSAPNVLSILGTMIFSSISDRIGHHKLLMVFSRVFLMTQYILLIFFRERSIWVNLIILGIFAIFTQAYYIMNSSLITIICKPEQRGQVTSFLTVFASAGWMIGAGLSSLIRNNLGINGNLAFAAGLAMLAGLVALLSSSTPWFEAEQDIDESELMKTIDEEIDTKGGAIPAKSKPFGPNRILSFGKKGKESSYWQILKKPQVFALLLTLAILDFGFGPFNVLTGNYLREVNLTDNFISISNVIATFLGLVISFVISRFLDKKGRKPFLIMSLITYPVIYGLMYLLSDYWIAVFILYCYPLYALKVPTANTIMADLTTEKERSRGLSLVTFEQIIMAAIGALVAALIADNVVPGIRIFPLFPTAFGLVAIIVAIFIIKESSERLIPQIKERKNLALSE